MQRSDIERYLLTARGHSIVVDARELAAVPGVVRTITIHRENRVTIEFDRSLAYGSGPAGCGRASPQGRFRAHGYLLAAGIEARRE
jgi:hypothetical protein